MPELPEMEALRRALDGPVSAHPILRAGPAHVATLKTFDPPLRTLEGRRLGGAERRGKRLVFPTEDGELALVVHLMTAGRLRWLRAGVWLLTPEQAEEQVVHLGPEALGLGAERLGEILRREARRLHPLLRDQRALAGIGRAWSNEILHRAKLSPFAVSTELDDQEVARLAEAIDAELERGLELRERGASNPKTYRVHDRLGEPCHACGTPLERVEYEEHTIYYCPQCQTGGRVLKDRRLSRLLR